ncbi:FabD/lysophospholipase-like protein [Mycena crocata]|nr:FabD/lysophospholipase-like protein [Mycena crocata]
MISPADGGGIRGLSSLLILETIMHRIKVEKELTATPLPCDYFDLIAGTSTGGIIAIMLGRLRMSVEEAIQCYDDLSGRVFRKSTHLHDGKYSSDHHTIVKDRTGDSETPLLDDGALGGKCRVFVCAMSAHNLNANRAVLFRSYQSSKEPPMKCAIWEAARATSAAPTFFERICIGPPTRAVPYIDGGIGHNNPARLVLDEAALLFTGQPACLVSIGTGHPGTIEIPKPGVFENVIPVGVITAIVEMATDCEGTAERMLERFEDRPKTYFRFNVDQGMQSVKLDDWDKMDKVTAHTQQYMKGYEVGKRFDGTVMAVLKSTNSMN